MSRSLFIESMANVSMANFFCDMMSLRNVYSFKRRKTPASEEVIGIIIKISKSFTASLKVSSNLLSLKKEYKPVSYTHLDVYKRQMSH